ncbi:MAG: phage head morphogenesis protein [Victivallaceae bacterium]|nr:phage head morphogenesis protein [Victivallaceae bacterium]
MNYPPLLILPHLRSLLLRAAAKKIFPYVRYHASVGSANPRSTHQIYDGMIFDKDDPWLRTHTPPWEFGCNCQLEQITAKEAGKTPGNIQPMTPAEQVNVESKSGFAFDPESAFDDFDMSSIKNLDERRKIYRSMASLAMKTDARTSFLAAPAKPVPTCAKPDNLNEITEVITQVKRAIDDHKPNTPYEFPDVKCSLGHIARERFDAIGMQPEDNVPVIFESPGASDYGIRHWKDHHLDDWKKKDFVQTLLNMLRSTIWNPLAVMKNTLEKKGKRISITSPDGQYIANLWKRGEQWVYSIQDAWDQSDSMAKK